MPGDTLSWFIRRRPARNISCTKIFCTKGTEPTVVLPLSIPSPGDAWQVFNLGQWLRDIGWASFGYDVNLRASTACIIIGLILAVVITSRRVTRRGAEPGIVIDVAIWAVPLGIVVGRLGHVATHPADYFGPGRNPLSLFFVWEGGVSLFGALVGGLIGVLIGCRIAGLLVASFLDAAVPGLLLGQAAARLGDWFDRQYFGTPTGAPWGLQIPSTDPDFPAGLPASTLFQPTSGYELLWDLVGIGVLLVVAKRADLQWGKVFALYLIWYGLGRSWFESLRIDDSLYLVGIRTNVWLAWVAVVVGVVVFAVQSRRHPGREPSLYRQGRGWAPTAAVHSDDTYSDADDLNDAATEFSRSGSAKATGSVTSGTGTAS